MGPLGRLLEMFDMDGGDDDDRRRRDRRDRDGWDDEYDDDRGDRRGSRRREGFLDDLFE